MQITLKPEVKQALEALAAAEDRSPTNVANRILAEKLLPKNDLLGRPVPKKKGGS